VKVVDATLGKKNEEGLRKFLILEAPICSIANEDPLGIVQEVQPEGSYIWDRTKMPYKIENYPRKDLRGMERDDWRSLRIAFSLI
jgi:hypothetical protein